MVQPYWPSWSLVWPALSKLKVFTDTLLSAWMISTLSANCSFPQRNSPWVLNQKLGSSLYFLKKTGLHFLHSNERDQNMTLQIGHFGLVFILSWRHLRNSRYRRESLTFPFLPKSKSWNFPWTRCSPLLGKEEHFYYWRRGVDTKIGPYKQTYYNTITFIFHIVPIFLSYFFTICHPMNIKPFSFVLSLLQNLSFIVKNGI